MSKASRNRSKASEKNAQQRAQEARRRRRRQQFAAAQACRAEHGQTSEQTIFHIHAHLTVVVDGAARQVPAAIGIPGAQPQSAAQGPFISSGTCFYWLHTHAADGIIHIESPVRRV